MKRLTAVAICLGLAAIGVEGAVGSAAADEAGWARQPGSTISDDSGPQVARRLMIKGKEFPTEDGFAWRPQLFFHQFRGDTANPCDPVADRSMAPRRPYGVGSRRYEWTSTDGDRIVLDAARSTVVRLRADRAATRYFRRYVHNAFDCAPRDMDGDLGHATAVYRKALRTHGRKVVVDREREHHASTVRRYIDIRREGRFVAIVELDLGEAIHVKPDLRRVDAIADGQLARLTRSRE